MAEEPTKVGVETPSQATPEPEPKKEEAKPEPPLESGREEVEKLTEELLGTAAERDRFKEDLNKTVSELIELRKKKAISPEEKEKLDGEITQLKADKKVLEEEISKTKSQRNEVVLNSLASAPSVDPTPKSISESNLSSWEEQVRKDKGWTVEKFLSMKTKYPDIVKPYSQ